MISVFDLRVYIEDFPGGGAEDAVAGEEMTTV